MFDQVRILKDNSVYRMADVFFGTGIRWRNDRHTILTDEKYRDSILYSYLTRKTKERDFLTLLRCTENHHRKQKLRVPEPSELVAHLRLGDIIDDYDNWRTFEKLRSYYLTISIPRHERSTIVTALHFGANDQNGKYFYSERARDRSRQIFDTLASRLSRPSVMSGECDDDFAFMVKSPCFLPSMSRISKLVVKLQALRNGNPAPADSMVAIRPFNRDTFLHAEVARLMEKWKVTASFETGTFLGHTTIALSLLCRRTYTVELSPENHSRACNLFEQVREHGEIVALLGSSPETLERSLTELSGQRMLFYLDAHWDSYWPLHDELDVIAKLDGPAPVIVIHDFKIPFRPEFGFDSYHGQDLDYKYVESRLKKIYGAEGYLFHYNTLATGAGRGVLFVEPRI